MERERGRRRGLKREGEGGKEKQIERAREEE